MTEFDIYRKYASENPDRLTYADDRVFAALIQEERDIPAYLKLVRALLTHRVQSHAWGVIPRLLDIVTGYDTPEQERIEGSICLDLYLKQDVSLVIVLRTIETLYDAVQGDNPRTRYGGILALSLIDRDRLAKHIFTEPTYVSLIISDTRGEDDEKLRRAVLRLYSDNPQKRW